MPFVVLFSVEFRLFHSRVFSFKLGIEKKRPLIPIVRMLLSASSVSCTLMEEVEVTTRRVSFST